MAKKTTTQNSTKSNWASAILRSGIVNSPTPEEIQSELAEIFRVGRQEAAEADATTEFSQSLLAFIERYHTEAIQSLEALLEDERIDPDLSSDALAALGESEDAMSHEARLMLLQKKLTSDHPRIRYGAIIGLISLDDPRALPATEKALSVEKVKILEGILRQLLEHLHKK